MDITGKVWCFFEQSGTFKNEFKKLGYDAVDVDIQNNFGETDFQIDLFAEIENAYDCKPSIYDKIGGGDLIMAFFPCIYFTGSTNPLYYRLDGINYRSLNLKQKLDTMLQRSKDRQYFFELIIKMVGVCLHRGIRLVIENPFSTQHYLCNNFFKSPDVFDKNRMMRGDYFIKPTGYWFFNCEPTYGCSYQMDKEQKKIYECKGSKKGGICSEERSLISPDYARNFICDFILGKEQEFSQKSLFG
jgi:hypothetical protein